MPPALLAGRVAVVTGGGAGIGRAIATALAEAGASLLVVDRDRAAAEAVAEAATAMGCPASALTIDIVAESSWPLIVERAAQLGEPEILVNNAAAGGGEDFGDVTTDRFDAVFAVSARASFFLAQAMLPAMKRKGRGRILNISSLIAAKGTSGNPHYAGAKAAMIGFVRSWAIELAPFGITANAVLPALTETPMAQAAYGPAFFESRAAAVPAGRLAKPEDVAALCAFLCTDAAAFVTGQVISPNGGEYVGAM